MSTRPVRAAWPTWAFLVAAVAGLAVAAGARSHADPAASLAAELRCPTCRSVSVADSTSPLARQMRAEIARRLAAGRSPGEIRAYFVSRYGSWILLTPGGSAAWLARGAPFAAAAASAVAVLAWTRRTGAAREHPSAGETP